MRISFAGTCPFPPRRDQAGPCILIELGNGRNFIFDYGPGCTRNLLALQVPMPTMNDIFLTDLHPETMGELPYLYAFAPWTGRWRSLRPHAARGHGGDDQGHAAHDPLAHERLRGGAGR